MEFDKNKLIQKWSPIIDSLGVSGETKDWLGIYAQNQQDFSISGNSNNNSFPDIAFPLVKRVLATTIANGGWRKSKKQQLKETRINKLRKIKGKKPNVILPDDEYIDGLVAVQPLAAPIGQLFYMDFVYKSPSVQVRKNRKAKLQKLNNSIRINKIKYIDEILQKIIQENG